MNNQRHTAFTENERKHLARKTREIRFRYMLSNRFRRKFDRLRFLSYDLSFLDSDFFSFNFWEIFINEDYFIEFDSETPRIIDCGSNIGLSILYFKHLAPQSSILAFEANPETFSVLLHNIKSNQLDNVEVHDLALASSDEGVSRIYFSRSGDLRSSLVPELLASNSEAMYHSQVHMARLSSFIDSEVDLLKMDIEGSEVEVLEEIRPKLKMIKNLLFEYHHVPGRSKKKLHDLLFYLEEAGLDYRINGVTHQPVSLLQDQIYTLMIHAYRGPSFGS